MPIETDCLEQDAVIWQPDGRDDYGRDTVGSASGIKVRWEHKVEENLDPDTSNQAVVAILYVSSVIPVGTIVWEGALADLPGTPTPLYQVISQKSVPDIKNREVRRSLQLINFHDTLPS